MTVPLQRDVTFRYLCAAPIPLALERAIECRIHQNHEFTRPVLDLGCGDGIFAATLFAEPLDVGVDPDARELEHAAELRGYARLLRCRGDAIPEPEATYSTVLSNSVLEHIPDLEPVLAEVHRVLAPGGQFHLTVPSDRFEHHSVVNRLLSGIGFERLAARYRRFFNRFWRHYNAYSVREWEAVARRANFEVVEAYSFNPPRVCLMNDLLAPLSVFSLLAKRIANRWIVLPWIRRPVMRLVRPLAEGWIADAHLPAEQGGLVYMRLRKPVG